MSKWIVKSEKDAAGHRRWTVRSPKGDLRGSYRHSATAFHTLRHFLRDMA